MITCLNLRPDYERPGYLRRIDNPAVTIVAGGWQPRAEITGAAGERRLVVTAGHTLGIASAGDVTATVRLDSEPLAVFAVGRRLIVMTAAGRSVFTLSGLELKAESGTGGASAVAAGCVLYPVGSPDLSWYAPSLTLSKAYGGERALTDADRRKVAAHAAAVYRGLDAAARSAGYLWQPAVACLRLMRADGTVAAQTAPVLLTHPSRQPQGQSLDFLSADTATIAGGPRDFTAWRAGVRLPAMPGAGVSAVQVVVAPMLHAASPDAGSAIVSSLGTAPFCTVSFRPGPSQEYGRPDRAAAASALAARLDECGTVVATLSGPFDTARETELSITLPDDIDSANERVRRLLAAPAAADGTSEALAVLQDGGDFTATACAAAGGAVVWSGLSVQPAAGAGPQTFAAATIRAAWRGYVRVGYTDGTASVTTAGGTEGAPVLFGPMLYVPSPRATSLEIGLDISGRGMFRDVFALTADAAGRGAACTSPGLLPSEPTPASSYTVPGTTATQAGLPGVIAVAPASDPFKITAVAYTAIGPVTSLVPARFGQAAWDFGRARFYAFGPGGIHSVATGSGLTSLSVSRLDGRPCGCPAVDSPYGVLAAAGSDVVCVSGSRVTTLRHGRECDGLAFDPRRHELLCVARGGDAEVLCPRRQWSAYTADIGPIDPAAMLSTPSGAYVAAGGKVLDISQPGPPAGLPVALVTEVCAARKRGAGVPVRSVTVDIEGQVDGMEVSVSRSHHGRRATQPDVCLRVSGRLHTPLRLPWYGPASATAVLTVSGTASAGLTIRQS